MTTAHLLCGSAGAGKTPFEKERAEEVRAVRMTLDEWMAVLFGFLRRADRNQERSVTHSFNVSDAAFDLTEAWFEPPTGDELASAFVVGEPPWDWR